MCVDSSQRAPAAKHRWLIQHQGQLLPSLARLYVCVSVTYYQPYM